jgi:Rieske Fe-S protein
MQQPKIRSKVRCTDGVVGELAAVVVDPLTRDLSHLVVRANGNERLVETSGNVTSVTPDEVQLAMPSAAFANCAPFRREDFLSVKDVEIAHLERHLDVMPGEALVPLPAMERDIERRAFLERFTHAIGAMIGLPLLYPVARYLAFPMFRPLDNTWLRLGRLDQFRELDQPRLVKFQKNVTEGYLEREYTKSHWAMKASPAVLEKIYGDKPVEFHDGGKVVWANDPAQDIVVFSGKCPHLGCAYRWRKHRRFGQVFVCPCHLSVFEPSGKVLDGPSPRPLDVMPVRTTAKGEVQIIDVEFKAGKAHQVRIV